MIKEEESTLIMIKEEKNTLIMIKEEEDTPAETRLNEKSRGLIEKRNGNFPFQLLATFKSVEAITPDIHCQRAIVHLCNHGGGDLVLDLGLRNNRMFRFCYKYQQTRHDETTTPTEERLPKKRGRPPKSAYLPGGHRYIANVFLDTQSLQSSSIDTDGSVASNISGTTLSTSSTCYVPMSKWSNKKAVFRAIVRILRQQLRLSTTNAHLTEHEITASAYKIEKLIFREAFALHLRVADAHRHYSNKNTIRERILRYMTEIFPTLTVTPCSVNDRR